jgi:multidrug efflux pump subunit AcrA (membrane-fusion protein)
MMIISLALSGCNNGINVRTKLVAKKSLESFAYANGITGVKDDAQEFFYVDKDTKISNVFVKVGDKVNEDQRLIQYDGDKVKQSSLDGIVTALNVRKGMVVESGSIPAIVVMDVTKLIVKADVRQNDISNIIQGQSVIISGDSIPRESKVTGRVDSISANSKKVGSNSMYEVVISINGQIPEFMKVGMNVNCDISLSKKENALVITYESVKPVGSDNFVFVVKNGKLEERKVLLGAASGITVEIKEGLSEGEAVVLDPKQNFSTGMRVNVVDVE